MTEPSASKTDLEAKFSDAMSTRESRWRRFSCSIRLKISGSDCARGVFRELPARTAGIARRAVMFMACASIFESGMGDVNADGRSDFSKRRGKFKT